MSIAVIAKGFLSVAFQFFPKERMGLMTYITHIASSLPEKKGDYWKQMSQITGQLFWEATIHGEMYSNPGWQALTGQSQKEMQGKGWMKVIHPDDRKAVESVWTEAIATNTSIDIVYQITIALRKECYILMRGGPHLTKQGNIDKWVGTWMDVTSLWKVSEDTISILAEEIRQSNEERETLFNVLPVGISIAHDPDCQQMTANPFFNDLLQVAPGSNTSLSAPESERPPFTVSQNGHPLSTEELPMQQAAFQDRLVSNIEFTINHPDGTSIEILGSAAPLYTAEREVRGAIGVFLPITERKRVESLLRDRERQFATLVEQIPDAIFRLDLHLRHLYMSPAIERITTIPPQLWLGKTAREMGMPAILCDEFERFCHKAIAEKEPQTMEFFHLGLWQRARLIPEYDPDGSVSALLGIIEDFTEYKQMEQDLAFRAALLDQAYDAILARDEDGTIRYWNKGAEELYGYIAEEAIGKVSHTLFQTKSVTDEEPSIHEMTEIVFSPQGLWEGELVHRLADGKAITVLSRQKVIQEDTGSRIILEANRDITVRKRLEYEIVSRVHQLEKIFDAMVDPVAIYGPDGHLLQVNHTFQALHGTYTPDHLTLSARERAQRLDIRDRTGQQLPFERWPFIRILAGETLQGDASSEILARATDGQDYLYQVKGAPFYDDTGKLLGAVVILHDLTVARTAENERLQILDVVAHEMRTPLTTLKLRLQVMLQAIERGKAIDLAHPLMMLTSLQRLENLTKDITAAARLEANGISLQMEENDIADIITACAAEQALATEREIQWQLPSEPVLIWCDPQRMSQVLLNLLANASKYTPVDAIISVTLSKEEDEVIIAVHDTGPGIAAEYLPYLFDRFYRAPNAHVHHGSGQGLGLGLYLCQQIVRLHKGHITVESTLGQGTTFTIRLPQQMPERS
jgi:PAS domain S-box-containing protein